MWAWGDSFDVTAQTRKLGMQIGVPVLPHDAHGSADIETALSKRFVDLQEGKKSPREYYQAVHRITRPEELVKDSPAMRRMLYEVGVL